jgi:putative heme-binding domain-containing protein
VFRISPFEQWRVERTTRRAGSEDAKRFPTTELVPGGYVTSASGICVWLPGAGKAFHGHVFVCDPANNLIHRDVLVPSGSTYRAERHDHECEFLASTDTWFRPVFLANGPGGGLYLADFYREMVETPLSLPDDIKARWNLNSRERGRIWRIRTKGAAKPERRSLAELTSEELAITIQSPGNHWVKNTAHRLLVERKPDAAALRRLRAVVANDADKWQPPPEVRLRTLWLLEAWGELKSEHLETALKLWEPHNRRQALRLAEKPRQITGGLVQQVFQSTSFPDAHVRFQLALSLGSLNLSSHGRTLALLQLARRTDADSWQYTAILSSACGVERELLRATMRETNVSAVFLGQLATLVGKATPHDDLLADTELTEFFAGEWNERQVGILRGLGAAYVRRQPRLVEKVLEETQKPATQAQRAARLGLLALVNFHEAEPVLKNYLQPQQPPALQQAALRALASHADRRVADVILEHWPAWGPQARREAQEVLFSRVMYLEQMLKAAEQGTFSLRQLDSTRREQLARHPNRAVRATAKGLMAAQVTSSRAEVIKKYQVSLTLASDAAKGKTLFTKHCAACHKFDGQGHEVAPDLHSALGNKTKDALLLDLLDPNREVDSRYVNYVVTTTQGRTLTGMLASESAQSVTLRRAEGVEETCLRSDIEEMQGTGKSLMPENFEEQLSPQDVADVLAYLLAARSRK